MMLATLLIGCLVPWKDEWDLPVGPDTDTDTDTVTDADTDTDSDSDSDTDTDADTDADTDTGSHSGGALPIEIVDRVVSADETWTADRTWVLEANRLVWVEPGATLTIEAGTVIQGRTGSAIAVADGGQLIARGTALAPIVFTSEAPVGSRTPGDWGGVVLMGAAPIVDGGAATSLFEGIDPTEPLNVFGGTDATHSCGQLEYLRIEFAGFQRVPDEELNSLTLAGCGSGTLVQNLQVHQGRDDGIEIFGGSVNLKNIVITAFGDDGLDWDFGWSGKAQFVVVQHWPLDTTQLDPLDGASALEGSVANPDAIPVLYNLLLLGSNDAATTQDGILLKSGGNATIGNAIVAYQTDWALDLSGTTTLDEAVAGRIVIENSVFWSIGVDGETWAEPIDADDENGLLEAPGFDNLFGANPSLPTPPSPGTEPFVTGLAQWVPLSGSVADHGQRPPNDGFFQTNAQWAGVVAPGSLSAWWSGWTTFEAR